MIVELSQEQLLDMQAAGKRVLDCYRVLGKCGSNIVGEVLRNQGDFIQMEHYPKGDVYDSSTHSQYYYHAHQPNEHGHFHCYVREAGMPEGCRPVPQSDAGFMNGRNDTISHLVGISMDNAGFPIGLFTTNRWVTADHWYEAEDVIKMLDQFDMDLSWPSWPTNIWLTAMIKLFRPQIEELIKVRNQVVSQWQLDNPDVDAFEDRKLEIASYLAIKVEDQISWVEEALKEHSKAEFN